MLDEREIVQKILCGDMRAFERLVNQYERLVFTVVQRLVGDEEDCRDICQEVFMKVHKGLKRFSFQSKPSTWIGCIAYHAAINYLKAHKKTTWCNRRTICTIFSLRTAPSNKPYAKR